MYLSGESYAGHYVPAIAGTIMQNNANPAYNLSINLVGLLIGNGWTDPAVQYGAYAAFGRGVALIEGDQQASLDGLYQDCYPDFLKGTLARPECADLMNYVTSASGNSNVTQVNVCTCHAGPCCYVSSGVH